MIFQVVIHQVYDIVKEMKLEECAENYMICQHEADEEINRTHCHIMLEGVSVSDETIRKRIMRAGAGGRGQYAILKKVKRGGAEYDRDKLGVYMLKGDKEKYMAGTYPVSKIEEWVSAWVAPRSKQDEVEVKEEKGRDHWTLMNIIMDKSKEFWKESNVIDVYGCLVIEVRCTNKRAVWDCMMRVLNENKVRLSFNELERFFLTIIRRDTDVSSKLYEKILNRIS